MTSATSPPGQVPHQGGALDTAEDFERLASPMGPKRDVVTDELVRASLPNRRAALDPARGISFEPYAVRTGPA